MGCGKEQHWYFTSLLFSLLDSYVNTSHLFNQVNTGLQVHTKINESPLNPFLLVLFLLQYKHVVVEELLQLFIGEVDAQLFKCVELLRKRKSFGK